MSHMLSPEEASRKFRKAEKKRDRTRAMYAYPESDEDPTSPVDATGAPKSLPLSQRLRSLQAELSSLEHELSDPSNPLLQKEREETNVDPGELIRGLVDVRSRLDKIVKEKEGRARLVGNIMHDTQDSGKEQDQPGSGGNAESKDSLPASTKTDVQTLVEVDKRVEELERLVGSSNMSLDDSSPLPPPLLPMITKLNSQLALLTQPRHIDSISRRLKLLLSDLERAAAAQQHRRQGSQGNDASLGPSNHEQLLTIVNRIAPSLPQIPHILSHLRTLSNLHSAAGEFQDTLKDLEQEQQKIHGGLQQLQAAVETVEHSLEENRTVVKDNVSGLDTRVNELLKRLEDIKREKAISG
ncbi:Dynamitin-domain-containing protein [Ephemerocybe angulata]|nr:Dynamitin-domain-containing protein [Tulosesus angulatus]